MKIKKKYATGVARVFISRKKAVKKLQLSLNDFRRICILKGIYPREPNSVKKANKGGTQNRIFYHLRDIKFLAQEPLLQKFREYKVFLRKVGHARAKKEELKINTLLRNKPVFSYHHIVKERYPTFSSALRDLDDALTLCFAFSSLTISKIAQPRTIKQCTKLVTEFMHYVIEARALKKVFISLKGIYYQAEIMGESVTWICGHERPIGHANGLDLSTLANFVDFYTCMLSFVNYRLFKSIGLFYPPQLEQQFSRENEYDFKRPSDLESDDRIFSLAFPIKKTEKAEPEVTIDTFPADDIEGENLAEKMRQMQTLKTLFSECKFFLNREVPKESLAFIIRSCGGFVCWEGCAPDSVTEASELITHQIVDRNIQKMDMGRVYVQPQWVFDCFNARTLLQTAKYAPSAILPPHLSPFVENTNSGEHISMEIERINAKDKGKLNGDRKDVAEEKGKRKNEPVAKGMHVKKARVFKENEEGHNLKLREMMIPKKRKRVYEKIKRKMKNKSKEVEKLRNKRAKLDAEAAA